MGSLLFESHRRVVYSSWGECSGLERNGDDLDDIALLASLARGDLEAFQAFYRRYAGKVLEYARQLSRDQDLSEDITQEVFTSVWVKAASFRADRGDVAGWLYTMTRNKLIDHWRRSSDRRNPVTQVTSEELERSGNRGRGTRRDSSTVLPLIVHQALAQVPDDQRQAIEMAYFGGLTYEETAEQLELPVGTLKSRIRTGLRAMRSLLGKD